MKKAIISLLSLFLVSGLMAGCDKNDSEQCKECEECSEIHEHTFANTWSKDETNHWYAAICEHTELSKDLARHSFDENNKCIICGYEKEVTPVPTELEIVSQPKSVKIDKGDGFSLSVGVNNPDLVKSYQWYIANYYDGDIEYEDLLGGTKANTDTYSLPAYYEDSTLTHAFRCEITGKDGEVIDSDWAIVEVNTGKDDMCYSTLVDYPILPGKTLNLKDTPYGTGSISLNEDGDHFVFDNVMFSNANFDTNFEALAFSLTLVDPEKTDYTFEFKGVNHFENLYWEDDAYRGGSSFQINALDLGGRKATATFTGSGSVSFYGGSYAIISNFMDIVQDIDVTISGQPYRYNGGIYIKNGDYTLSSNRTLNVNLNARVIHIDGFGDAKFEPNSNFVANLGVACGGNMASVTGVTASGDIFINSANIDIKMLLNAKRELEDSIYVKTWCFEADTDITVENSDVSLSILEYNNEFDVEPEDFASSVTAGAFSGEFVTISGSNINVDIAGKHIMQARALNVDCCFVLESSVNLDVRAFGSAGGFCCYTTDDLECEFFARNSDIVINLEMYNIENETSIPPYMNGGIYASKITLQSDGENHISINTNGVQTISLRKGHAEEVVRPHSDYSDELIKFDNATITSSKSFVHNENSYSSSGLYKIVVYESLYEFVEDSYVLIDNVLITYTNY